VVADDDLSTPPTTREWDAASYDRVSDPQVRWAGPVLDRLRSDGVGIVLDAGCGTGRVTESLLGRFPHAHVVAVDGSRHMLDEAARRLAPALHAGRVTLAHADLGRPLPLERPVDAVVSTATFHWVADHDALFANLAEILRPGGQLVAQCGGAGNIAAVRRALQELGEMWQPWHFATADETRGRLERCGFDDVAAWSTDEPTSFRSAAALEEFLTTVVLGSHLDRRPPSEREPFVRAVAERLPERTVDYVRLNLVATRTAA